MFPTPCDVCYDEDQQTALYRLPTRAPTSHDHQGFPINEGGYLPQVRTNSGFVEFDVPPVSLVTGRSVSELNNYKRVNDQENRLTPVRNKTSMGLSLLGLRSLTGHVPGRLMDPLMENHWDYDDRESQGRLVWIDELRQWVTKEDNQENSYFSFIDIAHLTEREITGYGRQRRLGLRREKTFCSRYMSHFRLRQLLNAADQRAERNPKRRHRNDPTAFQDEGIREMNKKPISSLQQPAPPAPRSRPPPQLRFADEPPAVSKTSDQPRNPLQSVPVSHSPPATSGSDEESDEADSERESSEVQNEGVESTVSKVIEKLPTPPPPPPPPPAVEERVSIKLPELTEVKPETPDQTSKKLKSAHGDANEAADVQTNISSVRLDNPPNLGLVVDNTLPKKPLPPKLIEKRVRLSMNNMLTGPVAPKPPQAAPIKEPLPELPPLPPDVVPEEKVEAPVRRLIEPPPLPPAPPTPPREPTPPPVEPVREHDLPLPKIPKNFRRRLGARKTDKSYFEEMERERLAEERKQKAQDMAESLRRRTSYGKKEEKAPHFEEYGFLAKYCILNRENVGQFRKTFEVLDEQGKKWLTAEQTMLALRCANPQLKDVEEKYLYAVLEMCDYDIKRGSDFKLFAVLAALSNRITSLDAWMRNLIGRMDFKMLEMKLSMCRHLWEVNVDPDTSTIPIAQLCVELRAGGVSDPHVQEVRQRLGWMKALNLIDFLTYIPLFIMLHESIVDNPLDESRTK